MHLWQYDERIVLGFVPLAGVTLLQVDLQLVVASYCQPSEHVVADPVIAFRVAKTEFVLVPRTIERFGCVVVLLDQQRSTLCCKTYITAGKSHSASVVRARTLAYGSGELGI